MKNIGGKRVLITGGAGFLGSHLCEKILNNGHEVLCVDNFYTGRKGNIATFCKTRILSYYVTIFVFHFLWKLMKFTILPVLLLPFITKIIR